MNANSYEQNAQTLVQRIRALMSQQPEIAQIESPWGLFKVQGFKCDDLELSYAQASAALAEAKRLGPLPAS